MMGPSFLLLVAFNDLREIEKLPRMKIGEWLNYIGELYHDCEVDYKNKQSVINAVQFIRFKNGFIEP